MALKIGEYEVTMSADGESFWTEVNGARLRSTSMPALKKKVAAEEAKLAVAKQFAPVELIYWTGGIRYRGDWQRRNGEPAIAPPKRAWVTGIEVKKTGARASWRQREEVLFSVSYDTPDNPEPSRYVDGSTYPYSDELFQHLTELSAEISREIDRLEDARDEGRIEDGLRKYCEARQSAPSA